MVSIKLATIAAVLSAATSVAATHFHVNHGCIYVNNSKICDGQSIWVDGGSAYVEARLDAQHCTKTFTWPSNYGDVYYGADNCFYDSNGQNIGGQCCV